MKLVFIYGPPAVGKLTVSEQLSKLTGYNIFHNHLTVDLARTLFEQEHPAFGRYLEHLRLDAFELAAKEALPGLIFTYCYANRQDYPFIRRAIECIDAHNGTVCFVQLVCDIPVLEQRVTSDTRQHFRKIKSVEKLRRVLNQHDFLTPIPDVASLQIDNSTKSPTMVAEMIVSHYDLP